MNCKALFLSGVATLFLSQPTSAQETTPQSAEKQEKADKTKEKASGDATKREWKLSWENRPSVRYGDLVRVDLRARFAGDVRDSGASLEGSDTSRLDLARRRIGVTGVIADVADFQIEREFASQSERMAGTRGRDKGGLNPRRGVRGQPQVVYE